VFRRNQWGCGGLILLIILGIVTAFIVPIILLILGALSPGGQLITYTVKPNGKIKKKSHAARR
jgi:fumarate reductase subunit D